jgi:L-aspartate oxidase
MEFMQFHPTTVYHPQIPNFLITEALRGAGSTLRNHLGTRFMYDYDGRLELAPRDVVSRAIHAEMQRLKTWCVYLDATHIQREHLEQNFPTIYEKLRGVNILLHRDWVPVVPAQHYSCGGVVTDLQGRTSVPGLYAAGEVACTGVHGANRLASNSLIEAVVFASDAAAACKDEPAADAEPAKAEVKSVPETDAVRLRRELRSAMTEEVGIVRTNAGLRSAKRAVAELLVEYDELPAAPFSAYSVETHNLMLAARHVVDGALARKVNVGLHYNLDLISGPSRRTSEAAPT